MIQPRQGFQVAGFGFPSSDQIVVRPAVLAFDSRQVTKDVRCFDEGMCHGVTFIAFPHGPHRATVFGGASHH